MTYVVKGITSVGAAGYSWGAKIVVLRAEHGHLSPPSLIKQFEEILTTKSEVDSMVKIFHCVAHGWAVRYKVDDEFAVKSAEGAFQDILAWFVKHLKPRLNLQPTNNWL